MDRLAGHCREFGVDRRLLCLGQDCRPEGPPLGADGLHGWDGGVPTVDLPHHHAVVLVARSHHAGGDHPRVGVDRDVVLIAVEAGLLVLAAPGGVGVGAAARCRFELHEVQRPKLHERVRDPRLIHRSNLEAVIKMNNSKWGQDGDKIGQRMQPTLAGPHKPSRKSL